MTDTERKNPLADSFGPFDPEDEPEAWRPEPVPDPNSRFVEGQDMRNVDFIERKHRVPELRPMTKDDWEYMVRLSNRGVASTSIYRRMRRLNIDVTIGDVKRLQSTMQRGTGPVVNATYRMHRDDYENLKRLAKSLGYEWPSRTGKGIVGSIPMLLTAMVNGRVKIEVDDGPEPEKYFPPGKSGLPGERPIKKPRFHPRPKPHEPKVNWYGYHDPDDPWDDEEETPSS